MVSNPWVKVVYLKVRFAVSLFKGERANLTFSIVQFSKQDTRSRRYTFTPLGHGGKHPWTGLACRLMDNAQQLLLRDLSGPLSCQSPQNSQLLFCF